MKILHGQDLVNELRKLSDTVSKRLWIAVPYIGSPKSIRQILGKEWFEKPSVNVKLLTDTSDLSCIDTETLQHFHNRGQIKTLSGLHAKIYIIDNVCLVTSANLTNTAFSKRHEIGMLFNSIQAEQVISTFESWWHEAENIKLSHLKKAFEKKEPSSEEKQPKLARIFKLPDDPGPFTKNIEKRFLNYDRLVYDYENFAQKYSEIQRIWTNKPLYLEVDGLLNYLYHKAPETPSKLYAQEEPRNLTESQQISEIKRWALKYKEWNQNTYRKEYEQDDIDWRLDRSERLQRLTSSNRMLTLDKVEIGEILSCLNCLESYPINRTKILSNNSVSEIRSAIDMLVNGDGQLAARMDYCNNIKYMGPSSMNEILGFSNPEKYPLINKNSICGLRFFGYQIKV